MIVADDTQRTMTIMEFQSLGIHLHRTGKDYVLTVQPEGIWALPHGAICIVTPIQHGIQLPAHGIRRAVHQQLSAAIRMTAAHHKSVATILFPPNFGVAEVMGVAALG